MITRFDKIFNENTPGTKVPGVPFYTSMITGRIMGERLVFLYR